ncbi:4Fe-4S dicluster domain-containing protein [Curtanaerobium respiraculi]|uniref:4Fe-4S dicluster domain-containing protein n=1 Tax=Curtanaerobium respiraculi TaxID=2949669 RepID=UPI0024B38F73|nr:4Fe-4S dicluster domain-containing protein [Curtanaerobium respiraculi]
MSAKLMRELTAEEIEEVYRNFSAYVNSLSFGYLTTDETMKAAGADLAMLKHFYTPQEALYIMDMPKDDFFTPEWFADKEDMDLAEAVELLTDLAKRGNIYRELRDDGKIWYHNAPAAHGIFEFHAGEAMDPSWLGPLFGTLGTGTLQICYDAGVPFYRCVPAGKELVKDEALLPEDDIFEKLKSHRRFCLSPCACLDAVRDNLGQHNCDHPKGVCLQTDKMADFYLDDMNLGEEITLEQAEGVLRRGIANDLAIQTTYAKDNEIICQCNVCHCGILPALKNWPGDAADAVTNYEIAFDSSKCVQCGTCIEKCTMKVLEFDESGYPALNGPCIGCGLCVINCPQGARILVRKPEDQLAEYPQSVWETYRIMEDNRRAKGALAD